MFNLRDIIARWISCVCSPVYNLGNGSWAKKGLLHFSHLTDKVYFFWLKTDKEEAVTPGMNKHYDDNQKRMSFLQGIYNPLLLFFFLLPFILALNV